MKLSLVIPFYNAENFIVECLLSITRQVEPLCEIVLVDDGSTDNSSYLIENEFLHELESGLFVLVRINNSGPGEARNVGVKASRGDYVGFLDSDDLLLPGYFMTVLSVIKNTAPQIIQFYCTRFVTGLLEKGEIIKIHRKPSGFYQMAEVRNDIFGVGKWFPCVRIFKRHLLVQNPFPPEKVFYEDLITLPFIFFQDIPIVLINQPLVAYRDNAIGTTRNHHPEHLETLKKYFKKIAEMPRIIALDALILNVSRTIIYFSVEFNKPKSEIIEYIKVVKKIVKKRDLLIILSMPEIVLLYCPSFYFCFEKTRRFFKNCCG